jgi:hypothetical protein
MRAARLAQARASNERLKTEFMAAYGGACACCGETEPVFLTLDHVGGRTDTQRGQRGDKAYRAARREGYPATYRILCWNCNAAHGLFGGCPHTKEAAA